MVFLLTSSDWFASLQTDNQSLQMTVCQFENNETLFLTRSRLSDGCRDDHQERIRLTAASRQPD
jgi:hypothetical protein